MRRAAITIAVALALAGCGGGGGGGGGGAGSSASTAGDATDTALGAALASAGVSAVQQPAAESAALVDLGRDLFFDKILAGNRNISCATCHGATAGTGDGLPVSMGEGATGAAPARTLGAGRLIARNAQPLFNAGVAGVDTMFWDGRVHRDPMTGELRTPEIVLDGASPGRPRIVAQLTSALAVQAMFPVTTPEEMRGQPGTNELADAVTNEDVWSRLMARLVGTANGSVGGISAYRTKFQAAYPSVASFDDLNFGHAARALAAFERDAFTALGSPFDRYVSGQTSALSAGQKRGALLFFGRAACADCHSGPLLSDFSFHALAVPQVGPGKFEPSEDRGRALITGLGADDYRFRTPPLRNVAQTGPWMHDGAFTTLAAAVRHHLDPAGGIARYDVSQLPALFAATLDLDPTRISARVAALDPDLPPRAALADADVQDLLDFLDALTDPATTSLRHLVPASVPSGLPVAD
jgi:cytochrome c peroxidase